MIEIDGKKMVGKGGRLGSWEGGKLDDTVEEVEGCWWI
jgi:hypothetical protein